MVSDTYWKSLDSRLTYGAPLTLPERLVEVIHLCSQGPGARCGLSWLQVQGWRTVAGGLNSDSALGLAVSHLSYQATGKRAYKMQLWFTQRWHRAWAWQHVNPSTKRSARPDGIAGMSLLSSHGWSWPFSAIEEQVDVDNLKGEGFRHLRTGYWLTEHHVTNPGDHQNNMKRSFWGNCLAQ